MKEGEFLQKSAKKSDIEEKDTRQMHSGTKPYTTFQKISDWLPLALITGGLVLDWANFEYAGVILIAGFLLYGIFGLIKSVRKKTYRGGMIGILKLVNDIAIIVLALALLRGTNTLFYLLMLILLDRLIFMRRA